MRKFVINIPYELHENKGELFMAKKLSVIFTKGQMKRIKFTKEKIFIDLHGMSKNAAYWFIKCIIGMCQTTTHLVLIHGYKHGTVIKEMIYTYHLSDYITSIFTDKHNMGQTHIIVR